MYDYLKVTLRIISRSKVKNVYFVIGHLTIKTGIVTK